MLNLPPKISPSGKRERRFFIHHHEALAEANRIRDVFRDYGRSIRMLPANRLVESIECWDLLDAAARVSVSAGTLRRIVIAELNKRKARDKSITFAALFDDYVAKLKKTGRSDGYLKQYRWCKSYLEFWHDTKVSDITPGNIKFSFSRLPSGNFNSNLRLLRAVLNFGLKQGFPKDESRTVLGLCPSRETRSHLPASNHGRNDVSPCPAKRTRVADFLCSW